MTMVSMKDLMYHAYNNRYAVGAFEIVSLDFLSSVIEAAEKSRSPVILNVVEAHYDWFDVELLMAAVMRAAKRASVPVAIHTDHCSSLESVKAAIGYGSNSLMFDGSREDLPTNIENTRKAVQLAHACGVPVEGGLGHVAGIGSNFVEAGNDQPPHTSANEAVFFIERTGVDFLAVSVGTVHGRFNGKPRLDFHRLARIRDSVNIPLVIHGGSGLGDAQYQKLIDHGVAKINYFTALADLTVKQIKSNISSNGAGYSEMCANIKESITAEVQRCMQEWRSAGRAAEILMQCDVWQNVEHLIVYNTGAADAAEVGTMLHKGRQQLSKIPGVLKVEIGKSVNEQGKYQYCWLIRFAHQQIIESYKNHPVHVAYADSYFRPVAADRITNDYAIIEDPQIDKPVRQLPAKSE